MAALFAFGMPGPMEMLIILATLLMLGSIGSIQGWYQGRTAVVLQDLSIGSKSQPLTSPIISIRGRRQGVIGFVLTQLGLSPVTTLTVDPVEARLNTTDLFGTKLSIMPLSKVAQVRGGVRKPVECLVFSVVALMGGLVMAVAVASALPFAIGIVIAIGLVVMYILRKSFFIDLVSHTGGALGVQVQPSVLEAVPIDAAKVLEAVAVVRDLVIAHDHPDGIESAPVQSLTPDAPMTAFDEPREAVAMAPPPIPTPATSDRESNRSPHSEVQPDKISFNCPECGSSWELAKEYAGRHGKCARCGTRVLVPQS